MKYVLILTVLLITACSPNEPNFWYPKSLKQVSCANGLIGEVYLMTNSRGWRSWPYYLDPSDNKEIELGTDCTMKTIKKFTTYKYSERPIRPKLNKEQRSHIIEGM